MATNPTLRKGSSGSSVTQLQTFLNNAGYNVGKADGSFGAKTLAGVTAYQNANKLTADGIVGKNTWGAINAPKPVAPKPAAPATSKPATSAVTPAPTVAPKPATSAAPAPAVPKPVALAAPKPAANIPTGLMQYNPLTGAQIKSQADVRVNPLYNANVEAAKQSVASNQLALDQQTAARQLLNKQQIGESKTLFGQQRQIASDQSLSRGLARSSIATNSQDRVSADEATNMGRLQQGLQTDVGAIETQKTLLANQLSDSLKRLDIDKATNIQAEIDRLTTEQDAKKTEITQLNNQYQSNQASQQLQQNQFDWTKTTDQTNQQLQKDQMGLQQNQFDWGKTTDQANQQLQKDQMGLQQNQFDWSKTMDTKNYDWKTYMDKETLKLQQAAAARAASSGGGGGGGGGRSGGSGSGGGASAYTDAYNKVFGSSNPGAMWDSIKGQIYAVVGQEGYSKLAGLVVADVASKKTKTKAPVAPTTSGSYWNAFR